MRLVALARTAGMVSLAFFGTAAAITEVLSPMNLFRASNIIKSDASTVHYIKVKWTDPTVKKHESSDHEGPEKLMTIHIYHNTPYDAGSLAYKNETASVENTHFFTAAKPGKYFVFIRLHGVRSRAIHLTYQIYSGEANRPNIISTGDVELSRSEQHARRLLDFAQRELRAEGTDLIDGEMVKSLYSALLFRAVWIVLLKVAATAFMVIYSGWKTKTFYTEQYSLVNKA